MQNNSSISCSSFAWPKLSNLRATLLNIKALHRFQSYVTLRCTNCWRKGEILYFNGYFISCQVVFPTRIIHLIRLTEYVSLSCTSVNSAFARCIFHSLVVAYHRSVLFSLTLQTIWFIVVFSSSFSVLLHNFQPSLLRDG